MLLDISPLCLYHNIPMILTHYWFDCPLNGCNQRYDMGRGYYVMRENAVEDITNKKPCPDCSLRLYLAKRVPTLGDSMWLCANEQCPSNRRKRIHIEAKPSLSIAIEQVRNRQDRLVHRIFSVFARSLR